MGGWRSLTLLLPANQSSVVCVFIDNSGLEVIVVDVDEGCALIRVRPNRKRLPKSYLTAKLGYKRDFLGHEASLLQLSTIAVCGVAPAYQNGLDLT